MPHSCVRCGKHFNLRIWRKHGRVSDRIYEYCAYDCASGSSRPAPQDQSKLFSKGAVLCSCGAPVLPEKSDTPNQVVACFHCKQIHSGKRLLAHRKFGQVVVLPPAVNVE